MIPELGCDQTETPNDDCCGAEERCGRRASWWHAGSGRALCAEHERSARKWSSDGVWYVGSVKVSFPAGWITLDPVPEPGGLVGEPAQRPGESGLLLVTADDEEAPFAGL